MNGLLVVVVGIPPILVTLATLYVATGWAEQVLNLRYIEVFKPIFAQFVTTNVLFDLPIMVAVGLGLYVVFAFVMKKTPFGRNVYAIGGNSRAARLSGLPVARVTVASYTIAGLLYGMAGFLTVCQLGMVSQSDLSTLNFQTIIVVLVGGLSISRWRRRTNRAYADRSSDLRDVDELPDDRGCRSVLSAGPPWWHSPCRDRRRPILERAFLATR